MWTDNETSLDLLGFRVHADLIRSVVTDQSLLPVTLGVFADWGGGKTSLMKMLEQSFDPDAWDKGSEEHERCERTACLYFNGWLFEGYDDAKSAILSSVLIALGEHKRFGPKMRDGCASLLKSVNWMRVAHLGLKHVAVPAIAAYVTGGTSIVPSLATSVGGLIPGAATNPDSAAAPKAKDAGEGEGEVDWEGLIKKDQSSPGPLDVRTFREKFGKLLQDSDVDSLVVLIDDLDRCSPERIIENLEAIKLFLNVDHTAFVIGADPRIVRHAISWKYSDHDGGVEEEAPTIVTDYLEKLIQFPYRLPRLSPAEIETYMALLFCQTHLTDELFEATVNACDEHRTNDRYSVFGYSAVEQAAKKAGTAILPEQLVNALVFSAGAAPLITEGLKGNPRQVKRFLNAFVLRKKLAEVAKLTNIKDDILVKLMILEYSNDKKFRELYEWQASQNGFPSQIQTFEGALGDTIEEGKLRSEIPDEWAKPKLIRWLKMKPSLSGIDLRDYFWIARDRLQSSITGMSMVPPIVRRVFEGLISDNAAMKSKATISAGEFEEVEVEMLLELLERNVMQNPSKKASFDAYRSLIEGNVRDAASQLASAITGIPASSIPPAVGGDLLTLIKAKPETKPVLHSVIESLKGTDTKVGKMITQLSKGKG
ncbi:KAP family P-loop NTPase fold protein [Stieleria varia]|uniref:KAP family P-loop domain protein n=1 Tax=Stieleria varia TaxID=2528005 RepID=A0A5C6B8T7_9BACT|nr:P-loop NTPase fold protein [Stieleria varia]TWU08380.1 KAP family P-loop domain protein [Stieleria varia]